MAKRERERVQTEFGVVTIPGPRTLAVMGYNREEFIEWVKGRYLQDRETERAIERGDIPRMSMHYDDDLPTLRVVDEDE